VQLSATPTDSCVRGITTDQPGCETQTWILTRQVCYAFSDAVQICKAIDDPHNTNAPAYPTPPSGYIHICMYMAQTCWPTVTEPIAAAPHNNEGNKSTRNSLLFASLNTTATFLLLCLKSRPDIIPRKTRCGSSGLPVRRSSGSHSLLR
jgi:hypothetical protein